MVIELTNNNFEQEVLKHPETALVDFFTPSCGPCRLMAPMLDEIAIERSESLKIVKLNAWESTDVATKYRVSAVPTFLLFQDGQPVRQRVGACSKKELLVWIDSKN